MAATQEQTRKHERKSIQFDAILHWSNSEGRFHSAKYKVINFSDEGGAALVGPEPVDIGQRAVLDAEREGFPRECTVRNCGPAGQQYRVGIEFEPMAAPSDPHPIKDHVDYYEVLQVSPKAEMETVNRVYRLLAARYHPDNVETGDLDRFLLLSEAHGVLGDPARRAEYDAKHKAPEAPVIEPVPLFQTKSFIEGTEGENNRRLGVLVLLYGQIRTDIEHPTLSLLALESLMAYPREHLQFTLWYLKQKELIVRGEGGSDYVITAKGVDYVEEHTPEGTGLYKLLERGKK